MKKLTLNEDELRLIIFALATSSTDSTDEEHLLAKRLADQLDLDLVFGADGLEDYVALRGRCGLVQSSWQPCRE